MDIAAYLDYKLVYSDEPSQSNLQGIVEKYSLPCWTNLIFKAQSALFKGKSLREVSDATVATFCPDSLKSKVNQLRYDPNDPMADVFTPTGLQVLYQQAILHAPESSETDLTREPARQDFFRALLMATYLCDMGVPHDPRTRERLLSMLIRDYYATPKANRDASLVRYWKLVTDPALAQASPALTNTDLDALFEEHFGCPAKVFMGLAFAMCVTWVGNLDREGLPGFFSYDPIFNKVALSQEAKARFLAHCCLSLSEYRNALQKEIAAEPQYWQFARKTFKKFPYMIVTKVDGDRIIVPVDLPWAAAKWSLGIYYSIFNAVYDDKSLRQRVSSQLGLRFQAYMLGRFKAALAGACEGEHRYNGKDTPDIMVREPGNVVFGEVKFTGVRIKTMLTGDLATFERDLGEDGNGLFDAAGQLTKAITAYVQGEFAAGGGHYADECIHPVIILSNPLPLTGIIRAWYEEKLQERKLLSHSPDLRSVPISRLEILNADEAEVLADLLGRQSGPKRFTDLLKAWRTHPTLKNEEFTHFCLASFGTARSDAVQAELKDVRDEIKQAIPFCGSDKEQFMPQ